MAFLASLRDVIRGLTGRRASDAASGESYEWERKTDQLYRRAKVVAVPGEDREGIVAFLSSRSGVEAYMEPRTLMYPLSVVLVAQDGESARFQLRDDSFIRDLTRSHGLQVFDAAKTGYPERMRQYRKGDASPEQKPD